jgi:hypothetical protein
VTDLGGPPAIICALAADVDPLIRAGIMNDVGTTRRPCARCGAELILAPSSERKVTAGAVPLCTRCAGPAALVLDAEGRAELARIDAPRN